MKRKFGIKARMLQTSLGLILLIAAGTISAAEGASTNALGIGTGLRFYTFSESADIPGFGEVEASISSTMLPLRFSYNYMPQGFGFTAGIGAAYALSNGTCLSVNSNEACVDLTEANSGLEAIVEANVLLMPTIRMQSVYFGFGLEGSRTIFITSNDAPYLDNYGFRLEAGFIPGSFPAKLHASFTYNPILVNEAGDFSVDEDSDISSSYFEIGVTFLIGSNSAGGTEEGAQPATL